MNSVEKMESVEKKVQELRAKVGRGGYTQPVNLKLTALELAELAAFISLQRKEIARLSADKTALLAALETIAGNRQCLDNLMSDKDIALAVIDRVSK